MYDSSWWVPFTIPPGPTSDMKIVAPYTHIRLLGWIHIRLLGWIYIRLQGWINNRLLGWIHIRLREIDSHGCFMLKSLRVTEAHECTGAVLVDKKLLVQMFDLVNLISSFVYTTVKTWSIYYGGILITSPSHLGQRNYSRIYGV